MDKLPPEITFIQPIGSSVTTDYINFVIYTNEPSNCLFSLGGGTNISMTSSDFFTHFYNLNGLSNQIYSFDFYCSDQVGNWRKKSRNIEVRKKTPSNPGDGGVLFLSRLDVQNEIVFVKGQQNIVLFNTYDQYDDLFDVPIINVSFEKEFNQTYSIVKSNFGEYKLVVEFENTTLQQNNFTIYVERDGRNASVTREFVILNVETVIKEQQTILKRIDIAMFSWLKDDFPVIWKIRFALSVAFIIIIFLIFCLIFGERDENGRFKFNMKKKFRRP